MIWLSIIPMGVILLVVFTSINNPGGKKPKLKNEIRTEDGYPKINLTVVQLENVPQSIEVELSSSRDALTVNSNGFKKVIPNEDVIDITLENANNIANNPQFSLGKAVTGTTLFGGIGAIAGLHGGNKDLQMLVVSYIENDEVEYMVFLQQYGKRRSIKAEQLLLKKVKNEILDVISGACNMRNLSNS